MSNIAENDMWLGSDGKVRPRHEARLGDRQVIFAESEEQHYAPKQLADAWCISENLIRDLFANEPDVFRVDRPSSRGKRAYSTIRIPVSVARRVHRRMKVAA